MKTRNLILFQILIVMLIVTLMSCASTRKQASTGEYIDDSVITAKLKSLYANDDFFKSFQIGVETFKGVVQLSGFVSSQEVVDKAVEIAKGVNGVISVKNDLIVK